VIGRNHGELGRFTAHDQYSVVAANHITAHSVHADTCKTRTLYYRKDDRTMRRQK